jgi:hypothetical protein
MELINLEKSTKIIKSFFEENSLLDFLSSDQNIYIGGSLPFMCLSSKITKTSQLNVGDIDIYTTNCPLLFRNLNKNFKMSKIVKTGVNVKFNIEDKPIPIPIQIITSGFENFNDEVLDEYDCGMVAVGYHPYSSNFVINKRFTEQFENKQFEVIHERTNPSRVMKLKQRAMELFGIELIEIKLDSNTDYRPYWKNKISISTINDLMPSPPYTQLYANKYHCMGCKEKQDYLICKLCQYRISSYFISSIEKNIFKDKYKKVVVFGGLNGLGKIIADEIVEIGVNSIQVSRTGRSGGDKVDTYPFDLEKYAKKYELVNNIQKNSIDKKINLQNKTKIINPDLLKKILEADLVIFNAYQTLEGDQSIWNTNLNTFNPELSEKRFKINCWGYTGLLQEILEERKSYLTKMTRAQDQVFVWIDANESRFEGKLSDGKHLELNMAKTACKQIFYTNANIMAGMGIVFLCWDCGWCSFHGISVDKIASKSVYLVPPKLSSQALLSYLSELDIDKLYQEKKFIHDMTFYKCVENTNIDFKKNVSSKELEDIIQSELEKKLDEIKSNEIISNEIKSNKIEYKQTKSNKLMNEESEESSDSSDSDEEVLNYQMSKDK